MHWLIVYSQSDSDSTDWYWEGMQGDYTDSIINEKVCSVFRYTFQDELEKNKGELSSALDKAFTNAIEETSKSNFIKRNPQIIMAIAVSAFLIFHAYFMLGLNDLKYRNADPAPENEFEHLYLNLIHLVEISGIEPLTPCLQSRCSPS